MKLGPDALGRLTPIEGSGIWALGAQAVPERGLKGS